MPYDSQKPRREKVKETIPYHFYNDVGKLKVPRGTHNKGGVALYSWDVIPECEKEKCPAFHLCDYKKQGKCQVQMSYMKSIQYILFHNFADEMTESALFRATTGLLPLYQQFCELKIKKLALNPSALTYMTDRGLIKMHPILKELRECVRLIEMTWHSLGLGKEIKIRPPEPAFEGKKPGMSYYNQMASEQPAHFKRKLRIVQRKGNGK
jgi:hypothetical protein